MYIYIIYIFFLLYIYSYRYSCICMIVSQYSLIPTHPPLPRCQSHPVAERQKTMAALWWSALGVEAWRPSLLKSPSKKQPPPIPTIDTINKYIIIYIYGN